MSEGKDLKLVKGHNYEINLSPDKLKFERRDEVGGEFIKWHVLVTKLKIRYWNFFGLTLVLIALSFIFSEWLLIFLVPLMIHTFKTQFDWGDKLDDQETWNSKFLTRMD